MLRWGRDKKEDKPTEAQSPRHGASAYSSEADRAAQAGVADAAVPSETLEEVLLEAGTITQEQLDQALAKQEETGAFLGQVLVDLGFIDENSLTSFLAKYCKIPHLSLLDYLIDEKQLELIPEEICLKYRLLPIDKLGKNLTVAMVNPLNHEALQKVRELCPTLRIKPILCAWNHYEAVTRRVFGAKSHGAAEMTAGDFGLAPSKPVKTAVASPTPPPKRVPEAPPPEPEPEPVAPEPEPVATIPVEPAPEPIPEPEPEPVSEVPSEPPSVQEAPPEETFDRDAVLGEVFKAEAETPPPKKRAVAAAAPRGAAGSIMQEMISAMRDSMRDTYAVLARRMELFQGLSPEIVARIFAKGMTLEFDAGQTLFEKGDLGQEMFAILGGKVEIRDGARCLATLSRGDMFGEMALICNEPRSATAVAVETTSVLKLTYDVFDKFLPKENAVQLLVNIIITLSERLRAANEYVNAHTE